MSVSKVFVAGHKGMVGRALVRQLSNNDSIEIVTRNRSELDLTNQASVNDFFADSAIDEVYLAAARVGGISANSEYPAEFIYENLMIQSNIIHSAHEAGVQKLLFLGSSCIYPKFAAQPMEENSLLTGLLEATNEPYAIAKIAGIKMCHAYNAQYGRDYRSVMPTNLFGPFDNFHPENSHVIPGLFQKFDAAIKGGDSSVVIWGTGSPKREFLHVDDMASAAVHMMNLTRDDFNDATGNAALHVNIGSGVDCEIRELATMIKDVTGYDGALEFDSSKPDGTPRKLMNVDLLHSTGWSHSIELAEGLRSTWEWYCSHRDDLREV